MGVRYVSGAVAAGLASLARIENAVGLVSGASGRAGRNVEEPNPAVGLECISGRPDLCETLIDRLIEPVFHAIQKALSQKPKYSVAVDEHSDSRPECGLSCNRPVVLTRQPHLAVRIRGR